MNNKSIWKDNKRWLPGVIISAVVLFLIFRLSNWKDLGEAFRTIKPIYILPGIGVILVWLCIRAVTLRILISNKAGFSACFRAINIGYLLNNLFPLRAGEFGRAIVLGNSSGQGPVHVLSIIVIERIFDLIYAAVLLLLTLPLALGLDWAKPVAVLTLCLVLVGLAVLFLMARNQEKVYAFAEKIGGRNKFVNKYILPQINSLLAGLNVLNQPKKFLLSLLGSGLSWAVAVFLYWIMLFSVVDQAPLWWGMLADSVLAMGIAVPSAPAALGVFEASLIGALALVNVSYSNAFAYAVLMHFLQFATTGLLGLYALAKEGRSLGSLLSEIRLKK